MKKKRKYFKTKVQSLKYDIAIFVNETMYIIAIRYL